METINKSEKDLAIDRQNQKLLIENLIKNSGFKHPIKQLQIFETQVSWVVLTGEFAYKFKKATKLGDFLDYSTPSKRQLYCHKEIELNNKLGLAENIYLEVVTITGSIDHPLSQRRWHCA